MIFVNRSPISGIPTIDKNIGVVGSCQNFGYDRNWTSSNKNQTLRPLYNWYFCHISITKWSPNCTRTLRKCFYVVILFLGPRPIKIPIVTSTAFPGGKELSFTSWIYLLDYQYTHRHQKKQRVWYWDDFHKNVHDLAWGVLPQVDKKNLLIWILWI